MAAALGLIGDQPWADYLAKEERAQKLAAFLEKTRVSGELLEKIGRAQQERLAGSAPKAGAIDEGGELSDSQPAGRLRTATIWLALSARRWRSCSSGRRL